MKNVIRDEFMRHDELFTSDSLNPVEQDYLSRMQSDELSEVEYTRALLNLGRMQKQAKNGVFVDFSLPDRDGKMVKVSDVVKANKVTLTAWPKRSFPC